MRRTRIALTAVVLAGAGTLVTAGPAAAETDIGIDPSGCFAGPLSTDIYGTISTRSPQHVEIVEHEDGTIVATCTFHGLPKKRLHEFTGEMWHRPAPGTVDDVTACLLLDYEGRPYAGEGVWYSEPYGTMTFGPGGTATSVCVFEPSYWGGL